MPEPLIAIRTGCPSCGQTAEPEEEDGVFKYVCECGYEFGHRRLEQPEDACSLGIPEDVRRGHSQPQEPQPVFLGTTIGKRPE